MKATVKRLLGLDQPRLRAVRPSRANADDLWTWLADFGEATVGKVRALVAREAAGVAAVLPGPTLAQFKLDPRASIDRLRRTLDAIQSETETTAVIWCFDGYQTHGLEPVEAEALLGEWVAVESVEHRQISIDRSKVVLVGRPRIEEVGVAFEIGPVTGGGALSTLAGIEMLQAPLAAACASILFVDHRTAAQLVRRPTYPVTRALMAGVADGVFAIGAIVRSKQAANGSALDRELAPMRALTAGRPLEYVRVRPTLRLVERPDALKRLREAGLLYDCSFVSGEDGSSSFFGAGAYWPQRFDPRTPAGIRRPDVPVEMVAVDVRTRSAADAWRARTNGSGRRLEKLLEFRRAESFHRDLESQLPYAQRYHEYRVFNWPAPDVRHRTTLFDAGAIGPRVVVRVRRFAAWLSRQPGTVRFPRAAIGAAAEREASSRLMSTAAALEHQTAAHEYLETTARDGALRADYRRFVELMPPRLGDVLELGAGYGQLAATLAAKARQYVCVELDASVLREVRSRSGLPGVAADIHRLPFRDASFETVIANNVIEHAFDPLAALGEIRRVLRPAGRFLALIPLDALNPAHQLRAHWWKADETNIANALEMAHLMPSRLTRLNLYELGVYGAFPSCNGFGCAVEAVPC